MRLKAMEMQFMLASGYNAAAGALNSTTISWSSTALDTTSGETIGLTMMALIHADEGMIEKLLPSDLVGKTLLTCSKQIVAS